MMRDQNLLSVKNLRTYFYTEDGVVKAVDGVDFEIKKGETLGMVGESGCGKSVSALSIMRLIPMPPGRIVEGEIYFKGEDILKISEVAMRKIRGRDISMIFQEPMTSLNPVYTVGNQISEAITIHQGLNRKDSWDKAIEMLRQVGIPDASKRAREYPHQMSGGMRQRVMIAMALSCNPELLIADEPTTSLDVTTQAQILDLIGKLQEEFKLSVLIITHNLGIVAEVADKVAVVYAGKVVEYAKTDEIFSHPLHPYTIGLLRSVPRLDMKKKDKLQTIEGEVPDSLTFPSGCKFHPRCFLCQEKCRTKEPPLIKAENGRLVRCWRYNEI